MEFDSKYSSNVMSALYPMWKQQARKNVSVLRRGHCSRTGDNLDAMENRIRIYREEAGLSQEKLGFAINVNRSGMQKIENKDIGAITIEQCIALAGALGKHPWQLVDKDFNKKEPSNHSQEAHFAFLPVIENGASAGGGRVGNDEISNRVAFKRTWLRQMTGSPVEKLFVVPVIGDSMEPTLHSGDHVLVDTEDKRWMHQSIFVIRYDSDLVVKRIVFDPTSKKLRIYGDNPIYKPHENVSPKDITIVGRVIWLGRKV